jgi:predicted nicotinamide N-methyase
MFRFSDKWYLEWNDSGDQLTAVSAACTDAIVTLSGEELLLFECIERLGGVTRTAIMRELAPELQAAAAENALNRLVKEGILEYSEQPPKSALFYTPMIYYQMLADPLKMDAYISALRRVVKPGMTVLDAGAGLGIFGVLAAQLGAQKVWAVDDQPIIYRAQQLARENGVEDVVECLQGSLFDANILKKIGKVDLIVSEFVGDEIFDEGILSKTIQLRKNFFSEKGGCLLPQRLQAFWAPIECNVATNRLYSKLQATEQIGMKYGLNVQSVCDMLLTEGVRNDFSDRLYVPSFSEISPENFRLLGEPTKFFDGDLREITNASVLSQKETKVIHGGRLDGVLVYFTLDLDDEVKISSSPWLRRTHWPQVIYLRKGERSVAVGEQIRVSIAYFGGLGLCVSIQ